ncbi:MAG: 50S ribosomal protein L5 [Candidatus Micrarchaeia archaeon]
MDMREVKIEKVTVNIGAGESGEKLKKAKTIIERITGRKAAYTKARKRVQAFGIKKGETIGVKVTLRGKEAENFLRNAFDAVDFKLNKKSIDKYGNFAFGVKEYIDFPGAKYDPTIGIIGFDVCGTMTRPGKRVELRRRAKSKIKHTHKVTPEETEKFLKEKFKVNIYE